jgi:hypothetical protein
MRAWVDMVGTGLTLYKSGGIRSGRIHWEIYGGVIGAAGFLVIVRQCVALSKVVLHVPVSVGLSTRTADPTSRLTRYCDSTFPYRAAPLILCTDVRTLWTVSFDSQPFIYMRQLDLLSRVVPAFGALARAYVDNGHNGETRLDAQECYSDIVGIGSIIFTSRGEWTSGLETSIIDGLLEALATRLPKSRPNKLKLHFIAAISPNTVCDPPQVFGL